MQADSDFWEKKTVIPRKTPTGIPEYICGISWDISSNEFQNKEFGWTKGSNQLASHVPN